MASTHWILASCFDPAYGWKCKTINSEASIMFVRIHCLGSVSAYVYHSTSCCESLSTKQSHGSATTIPSLLILIKKSSPKYPALISPHQPGTHRVLASAKRSSSILSQSRAWISTTLWAFGQCSRCGWGNIPISNDHWDASWLSNPHLWVFRIPVVQWKRVKNHVKSPHPFVDGMKRTPAQEWCFRNKGSQSTPEKVTWKGWHTSKQEVIIHINRRLFQL